MSNKRNYNNYSKQNDPKKEEAIAPVEQKEEAGTSTQVAQPEPETPEALPGAPEVVVTGVVVNCERLNIRAEAKADAKIVGTFFKGQEIEIYLDTSTDDFYDVSIGYCMKKYIKINN